MQTIGERLEEARKKKGVSIREAAEATKIRGDYLQKFEGNQFDIGLTEIYTRGFLRTYASYLKVPVDRVMSDYAALGRGDVRPRQPSREVYGRMDISVASAAEAAERAPAPAEPAPQESAPATRPQPHYPRGTGSSLPKGPDPAVVFKWVKIGGAVVALLIVVFVLKALFSGGSRSRAGAAPAAVAQQSLQGPVITLLATNPVHVKVQKKNPDGSYGDVLFDGDLRAGESRVVPRPSALYITASQCENLLLDVNGRRVPMGMTGYATGQLPPP